LAKPDAEDVLGKIEAARRERSAVLDLSFSDLSQVPVEIGELEQLEDLALQGNRLSALPPSIAALTRLRGLYLWDNQLTELPAGIGNLARLEYLDLSDNRLTTLPADIVRLTRLQCLDLRGNHSVTLPAAITQLPHRIVRPIHLRRFYLYPRHDRPPSDRTQNEWPHDNRRGYDFPPDVTPHPIAAAAAAARSYNRRRYDFPPNVWPPDVWPDEFPRVVILLDDRTILLDNNPRPSSPSYPPMPIWHRRLRHYILLIAAIAIGFVMYFSMFLTYLPRPAPPPESQPEPGPAGPPYPPSGPGGGGGPGVNQPGSQPGDSRANNLLRGLQSAMEGTLIINSPSWMWQGTNTAVTAALAPDQIPQQQIIALIQEMRGTLDSSGRQTSKTPVVITPVMSARLSGDGFRIDPAEAQRQTVLQDRPTGWSWTVTPSSWGSLTLRLQIDAELGRDSRL
jgi:hypothetical protein